VRCAGLRLEGCLGRGGCGGGGGGPLGLDVYGSPWVAVARYSPTPVDFLGLASLWFPRMRALVVVVWCDV